MGSASGARSARREPRAIPSRGTKSATDCRGSARWLVAGRRRGSGVPKPWPSTGVSENSARDGPQSAKRPWSPTFRSPLPCFCSATVADGLFSQSRNVPSDPGTASCAAHEHRNRPRPHPEDVPWPQARGTRGPIIANMRRLRSRNRREGAEGEQSRGEPPAARCCHRQVDGERHGRKTSAAPSAMGCSADAAVRCRPPRKPPPSPAV